MDANQEIESLKVELAEARDIARNAGMYRCEDGTWWSGNSTVFYRQADGVITHDTCYNLTIKGIRFWSIPQAIPKASVRCPPPPTTPACSSAP
jgi:hypothetical protein